MASGLRAETFKHMIGETRDPLPARPGAVERYDHVYTRKAIPRCQARGAGHGPQPQTVRFSASSTPTRPFRPTRRSHPQKQSAWPTGLRSTTRPNMGHGSTGLRSNWRHSDANASPGAQLHYPGFPSCLLREAGVYLRLELCTASVCASEKLFQARHLSTDSLPLCREGVA